LAKPFDINVDPISDKKRSYRRYIRKVDERFISGFRRSIKDHPGKKRVFHAMNLLNQDVRNAFILFSAEDQLNWFIPADVLEKEYEFMIKNPKKKKESLARLKKSALSTKGYVGVNLNVISKSVRKLADRGEGVYSSRKMGVIDIEKATPENVLMILREIVSKNYNNVDKWKTALSALGKKVNIPKKLNEKLLSYDKRSMSKSIMESVIMRIDEFAPNIDGLKRKK